MDFIFSIQPLFSEEILNALHILPSPAMDWVMHFISSAGRFPVYVTLSCLIVLFIDRRKGLAILALVVLSFLLNHTAKDLFFHPRPDPALLNFTDLALRNMPRSPGFPSGHAQAAMVFFGSVFVLFRKREIRVMCTVMVILISYSRMYLGVHYPGDIVAGLLFGAFILLSIPLFRLAAQRLDAICHRQR